MPAFSFWRSSESFISTGEPMGFLPAPSEEEIEPAHDQELLDANLDSDEESDEGEDPLLLDTMIDGEVEEQDVLPKHQALKPSARYSISLMS